MSTCNKFTCLNEPDLETNEHKRKAKKKIREINILEKKPFKTAEEWDKINKKEYYIAILTPVEVDESQHIPNKKKKEFKQKEKNWKNTEKKLKEKIKSMEQNTQQDNPVEEIIQKEFEKKKKEYNGNKDKAWRKLTTMYHPDKLKHIIGNNLATHLSQIDNSLKS